MGQPAACMIESNRALSVRQARYGAGGGADYGAPFVAFAGRFRMRWAYSHFFPVCSAQNVDNFVDKCELRSRNRARNPGLFLCASGIGSKNIMQINVLSRSPAGLPAEHWSTASVAAPVELSIGPTPASADV